MLLNIGENKMNKWQNSLAILYLKLFICIIFFYSTIIPFNAFCDEVRKLRWTLSDFTNDPEAYEKKALEIAKRYPKDYRPYYWIADYYSKGGHFYPNIKNVNQEKALHYYEKALRVIENDEVAFHNTTYNICKLKEDYECALENKQKALMAKLNKGPTKEQKKWSHLFEGGLRGVNAADIYEVSRLFAILGNKEDCYKALTQALEKDMSLLPYYEKNRAFDKYRNIEPFNKIPKASNINNKARQEIANAINKAKSSDKNILLIFNTKEKNDHPFYCWQKDDVLDEFALLAELEKMFEVVYIHVRWRSNEEDGNSIVYKEYSTLLCEGCNSTPHFVLLSPRGDIIEPAINIYKDYFSCDKDLQFSVKGFSRFK
jgi:hypothetical protein